MQWVQVLTQQAAIQAGCRNSSVKERNPRFIWNNLSKWRSANPLLWCIPILPSCVYPPLQISSPHVLFGEPCVASWNEEFICAVICRERKNYWHNRMWRNNEYTRCKWLVCAEKNLEGLIKASHLKTIKKSLAMGMLRVKSYLTDFKTRAAFCKWATLQPSPGTEPNQCGKYNEPQFTIKSPEGDTHGSRNPAKLLIYSMLLLNNSLWPMDL